RFTVAGWLGHTAADRGPRYRLHRRGAHHLRTQRGCVGHRGRNFHDAGHQPRKAAHRLTHSGGPVHRRAGLGLGQHRLRGPGGTPPRPSRRGLHTLQGFPGRRTDERGAADLGRSGRPHRTGAPGNPHRHPHRNGRGTVPTRPHPPTPQQPITAITTLQGGLVPTPKRTARAAIALASTLLLSACGSQPAATEEQEAPTDGYPVTVQNCGAEVTFDAAPEQLVLLKSASVPALHELGVLDRAVARAGAFPEEYFDDATLAE